MILAIGYRVRSARGAQFRKFASTILKEYLIEGAALDIEKLTSRKKTNSEIVYLNVSVKMENYLESFISATHNALNDKMVTKKVTK